MVTQFRLEVQQVESVCNFRLTWGTGQQLVATVPYPTTVIAAYGHWYRSYLAFYQNLNLLPLEAPSSSPASTPPLRGRAVLSGALPPTTVDWESRLRHDEITFQAEFKNWLNRRELVQIRAMLAQAQTEPIASQSVATPDESVANTVDVFLHCYSLELERLPWEDWKIIDFGSKGQIRFVRSPLNIPEPTTPITSRRRLRLLAILGDNSGQNFSAEKAALKKLEPQIKVEFEGWQATSGIQGTDLKRQICSKIQDPDGWDILFFAGHSNEKEHAGGEIAIAPEQAMLISEILPSLQIAKDQGLQFAIFNSCSGIHIAQALISIGLSQVVIMREPIHNQVASVFLVEFAQRLKQRQDFHAAFLSACNYLKQVDKIKQTPFPSAYLIPSLFCHLNAKSIALTGWGARDWLKQILPKRREAIVLGACLVLSVLPQVRESLLNQRMWVQAYYRDVTRQIPPSSTSPVLLVQIDQKTINSIRSIDFGNKNVRIMDRKILAQLVKRLTESGAKVIGFDYLFDIPIGDADRVLSSTVKIAFDKYGT